MSEGEAKILAELRILNARLEAIAGKPKAHMTQRAFAKLAGLSVRTVQRKIGTGEILTKRGRIPASELGKFTS